MQWFETHFHWDASESPDETVRRARAAGVAHFLAIPGDLPAALQARDFARQAPSAWFAAGVHPHEAGRFDGDLGPFAALAADPKMAAVGEIGLDYFYEHSDRGAQNTVFAAFLGLALELGKPAVIHCRDQDGRDDAYQDAYAPLQDFARAGGSFVVHCFTGTPRWLDSFLALGAYIGVTGIVTFPKASNVRDLLPLIPPGRLLLETDSPYLAPIPHRGKPNHPENLPLVARKVAEILGMELEALAETTTNNAFAFLHVQRGAATSGDAT